MNADQAISEGGAALKRRDFRAAEELFKRAVALDPSRPEAHLKLAMSLTAPERSREAITAAEAALKLDPSLTPAYGILSGLYQRLGRFDDAIAAAQSAIRLDPNAIPAYADIVRSKRMDESDRSLLNQIEALERSRDRSPVERMILRFALGKAHDDLGEYAVAIRYFDEANRLGYELFGPRLAYSPEAVERETLEMSQTYTQSFFERLAGVGVQCETPVFIVGMIRSGTTLLDSILSQHPEIGSAGELKFWENESAKPLRSHDDLKVRAGRFLNGLKLVGDQSRIIDKFPLNYRHIGLIHVALPQARFIHLRRDRADTCLSIYTTEFGPAAPRFAYSKANIAHAYDSYSMLMEHWREVLTPENFHEVDYESIAEEPDRSLRPLVEFLGLDWHEGLGVNRATSGEVLTPSRWQVRQPLYRTSVGRWKRYAAVSGLVDTEIQGL